MHDQTIDYAHQGKPIKNNEELLKYIDEVFDEG